MPSGKLDADIEKGPVRMKDFRVLREVAEGGPNVETEYELERRYTPTRLLSAEELVLMPSREIDQAYVKALDSEGAWRSFRLRETRKSGPEGTLLRVAEKTKIENTRAKLERQRKFKPEGREGREFEQLWERRDRNLDIVYKTRYYTPYTFTAPDGKQYEFEIHYDVHPTLKGFIRIEVEFKGSDPDEAERFLLENGHAGVLPDWVGEDISDLHGFGGKDIARSSKEITEARMLSPNAKALLAEVERQKKMV